MASHTRIVTFLLLLVLVGMAFYSIKSALHYALFAEEQASLDFQWDAARVLLSRQNPYTIALAGQNPPAIHALPDNFEPNQLPSALLILAPYTLLEWEQAKIAWALTNAFSTVAIVYLLFRLFAPLHSSWGIVAVALLWVAGYTWQLHIGVGQHTLFSLALFLNALVASQRREYGWAGVALAFALLKYTTILPLCLYFVWQRQWKPLVIAFALHFVAHGALALWLNENPLTLLLQPFYVSQQLVAQGSLDVFALAHTTGALAWIGLGAYQTEIAVAVALVILGGATWLALYRAVPSSPAHSLLFLAFLALLSNLVLYHRLYDHVTLIIPLVALVVFPPQNTLLRGVALAVGALFMLLNFIHPLLMAAPPTWYLYLLVALAYLAPLLLALYLSRRPAALTPSV